MNVSAKPSDIVAFSGPETPIGNAKFGGRLHNTAGTGFSQFRVYGLYALVLLVDGAGRYRDRRGTDRRLQPGDLLVVFPEHAHQYGPEPGDRWDEVFIAFHGAAFDAWRSRGLDPLTPVWSLPNPTTWTQRLVELLSSPSASLAEATRLASAIHSLIADVLAQRDATRLGWLDTAMQQLAGGATAPPPSAIAKSLGMSPDHFRKIFKAATGESPSVFRRRRRLAQAALMLQRVDLTLDLIAESLGFCDAFHLSKAFKQQFGQSPDSFRNEHLERRKIDNITLEFTVPSTHPAAAPCHPKTRP